MKMGTACVTGASSGIGSAFAEALAREGYHLILTGRREDPLRLLADKLPVPCEVFLGDLREPSICARLSSRLRECADLRMVIHNAGYGHDASFLETPVQALREMGELHVQCATELTRVGAEVMGTGGALILVSSLAAFTPAPGPAMYTATKAFQVALGTALQADLADQGVRLQVLCPGFTHTGFHDRLDWDAERRKNRGLVRWMRAEEVVRRSLRRLHRRSPWAHPVYVPGWSNRLLLLLVRLTPRRLYLALISRMRF
jgi:short-subunit dehydrogenase